MEALLWGVLGAVTINVIANEISRQIEVWLRRRRDEHDCNG